jgi:hypothetical protein
VGCIQRVWDDRRQTAVGDVERADKAGGKFTGLHPEGQTPSGEPYPLHETIAGSVRLRMKSGGQAGCLIVRGNVPTMH